MLIYLMTRQVNTCDSRNRLLAIMLLDNYPTREHVRLFILVGGVSESLNSIPVDGCS